MLPALTPKGMWPEGKGTVYDRTWPKNGKDERTSTLGAGSIKKKDAADLSFPHLQHLPFSTFARSSPLPHHCPPIRESLKMQFEVLATCHTTRARVSRMKLARRSFDRCIIFAAEAFQIPQME
jgi:hypothetical protein